MSKMSCLFPQPASNLHLILFQGASHYIFGAAADADVDADTNANANPLDALKY